jgi:hypothetical protein
MAGEALGARQGREEHDGVTSQLDILAQRRALIIGQGWLAWVELQGLQAIQINWKAFVRHAWLLVNCSVGDAAIRPHRHPFLEVNAAFGA